MNKITNIKIGDIYSDYEVISDIYYENGCGKVKCKCKCGLIKVVCTASLKRLKKCNKCSAKDKYQTLQYGEKKHQLTFLKYINTNNKKVYIKLLCDCGHIFETNTSAFGKIKSCKKCSIKSGQHSSSYKGCGYISKTYFEQVKLGAKIRELSFDISIEDMNHLLIKQNHACALTGLPIAFNKIKSKNTASLDRIDSNKGYIADNIQWVHKDVNKMKQDFNEDYFIDMCKKISNYKRAKVELDTKLNLNDVLMVPKSTAISSREEVSLISEFIFNNQTYKFAPIFATNLFATGQFNIAKILSDYNICTSLHKFYSNDDLVQFAKNNQDIINYIFYTFGMSDIDFNKLKNIFDQIDSLGLKRPNIHLDVANGYMKSFHAYVEKIKNLFPAQIIMAGNICTAEGTQRLAEAGADLIRCGIGCGQQCLTSSVAGVGYGQFSAIAECSEFLQNKNKFIVADGGCKEISDIVHALGAGARFAALGTMLSAHNENDGEWKLDENGNKLKMKVYGMSSSEAMLKHYGKIEEYRASEGRVSWIENRGPIQNTIKNIFGGIRSACSYIGCKNVENISRCANFIKKS